MAQNAVAAHRIIAPWLLCEVVSGSGIDVVSCACAHRPRALLIALHQWGVWARMVLSADNTEVSARLGICCCPYASVDGRCGCRDYDRRVRTPSLPERIRTPCRCLAGDEQENRQHNFYFMHSYTPTIDQESKRCRAIIYMCVLSLLLSFIIQTRTRRWLLFLCFPKV